MATENRPYQGYPFVNPMVTDVPTVDSATATRWADLPRRQVYTVRKKSEDIELSTVLHESNDKDPMAIRQEPKEAQPVVYIDLPEDDSSNVYQRIRDDNRDENNATEEEQGADQNATQHRSSNSSIAPVVYIDLPEPGGSGLAQANPDPQFVQDTIFYDPFENRPIELLKEGKSQSQELNDGGATSDSEVPPRPPSRPAPTIPRPTRPANLNLASPSGSSAISAAGSSSASVPTFLTKESQVYGRQSSFDDEFNLSPIPVNEFPEPPPAYSEIDTAQRPGPHQNVIVEQPRATSVSTQPRTQVILPQTVEEHSSRKFLTCHHCGNRVHTLVIRQTGAITHVLAMMFLMICLFPVTILIYCMDCCKYKNHYCPNCNSLVGYEVPILCQKMVYVK